MPLFQSAAARGMFPTEQTKLNAEIIGPINAFSIAASTPPLAIKKAFQKLTGMSLSKNPATTNPPTSSKRSIIKSPMVNPAASKSVGFAVLLTTDFLEVFRSSCVLEVGTARGRKMARRTIITTPPKSSATANSHPSSAQMASPRSKTRFVLANMKTIEVVKSAPLSKRLLAIELAAYEQLELIAPRKPARVTDAGLCFPSFSTMSRFDPKA